MSVTQGAVIMLRTTQYGRSSQLLESKVQEAVGAVPSICTVSVGQRRAASLVRTTYVSTVVTYTSVASVEAGHVGEAVT